MSYIGFGSTTKMEDLQIAKALAANALTPKEVDLIRTTWAKWDADYAKLTTGKKKIKSSEAIAIIGERPSVTKIVGHPLVSPTTGQKMPDSSGDHPLGSDGLPWLPILGGLGLAVVGIAAIVKMRSA